MSLVVKSSSRKKNIGESASRHLTTPKLRCGWRASSGKSSEVFVSRIPASRVSPVLCITSSFLQEARLSLATASLRLATYLQSSCLLDSDEQDVCFPNTVSWLAYVGRYFEQPVDNIHRYSNQSCISC